MGIVEATAEAPCPLFAGRGLDKRGFTLSLPNKTYLSCTPDNIDQEKCQLTVFNYDLAEYVYKKEADARAFGVYVETGAYTDQITDGKTMFAAYFFIKLTEDYDLAPGEQHNADIRAISAGVDISGDLSGVATGAYIGVQFREVDSGAVIDGFYLQFTQTYGVIGLEVRTEAKEGGAGTGGITVGAAAYGVVGLLIAQKNDAAFTGNYAAIAIHAPYEGSDAIVGTTYGIRFDNDGLWAGTLFDTGIYVKALEKGVDIYTIMDETITSDQEAIVASANIGSSGAVTGNLMGILVQTYCASAGTLSGENRGIYVQIYDERTGNKEIYPLRLEYNGVAVANAFISIHAQAGLMRYFLSTSTATDTWGSYLGVPSGTITGWLRVRIGDTDRYIALYPTAP